MRSRGSNHLSARANARKDPEGQQGAMHSTATCATASISSAAVSATPAAMAPNGKAKPRKFALPGNAKPKKPLEFRSALRRKHEGTLSRPSNPSSSILPLVLAVLLWYSLGVVSISSSKVLLTPYQESGIDDGYLDDEYESHALYQHVGGLPPLFLTVQQLLLGSTFLRLAIHFKFLGLTKGLVPLDSLRESLTAHTSGDAVSTKDTHVLRYLINTGIFFALGFLTTNMAFGAAAPTYVETLKAAEPITSAIFAVLWGIEVLTVLEILGLIGIVGGVLLSTTGSNHSASMAEGAGSSLVVATAIVMASNLCFSLRGLYQKLFRKGAAQTTTESTTVVPVKRTTTTTSLDDLNLQFRMQQTGVLLLILPTVVWNGPGLCKHAMGAAKSLSTPAFCNLLKRYALWSVGNGLAFSSYNLASTYLLTRISVVHHAALNCTRRIFAIVCTGLLFRIPISGKSAAGIGISFVGFMVFTKAKTMKNQKAAAAAARKPAKSKTRDVPIGNGEIPSFAHETTLAQEDVLPAAAAAANGPTSSTSIQPLPPASTNESASIPKTDFGTHRRANRSTPASTATSRFPLPGNNRSVASPFPRSPPPPPPPPPPKRGL